MAATDGARKGILLLNLGTPDSPEVPDVRRFLAEFLTDPLVIELPAPLRFLLVHGVILPFRPKKSAAAYKKIWTERGSPLRYHGDDLAAMVEQQTGRKTAIGMRYGNPSVASALDKLTDSGVRTAHVVPLFPQYSEAAWVTVVEAAKTAARERQVELEIVAPFFEHPGFLDAFATLFREHTADLAPDRVLMSFHGLPVTHLRRTDRSPGGRCLTDPSCCDAIDARNEYCYRAQCFATARGLANRLHLEKGSYDVTFQSRLGRRPWIKPFTDEQIRALAQSGSKRLAVICPSFVADCLETTEEIGMAARASFIEHGGEELTLVPCLNSEDSWVDAVVSMVEEPVRA